MILNGIFITFSKVFKYLGVLLDNHLTFNEHINYVNTKVSRKLGILSRVRPLLTTESANRLYKSMILPLLEYCDITWHGCIATRTRRKLNVCKKEMAKLSLRLEGFDQ